MFHSSKDRTDILHCFYWCPTPGQFINVKGFIGNKQQWMHHAHGFAHSLMGGHVVPVLYNCDLASQNVFESMNTNNTKAGKKFKTTSFFFLCGLTRQYQQSLKCENYEGYIILSISSIRQKLVLLQLKHNAVSQKSYGQHFSGPMKIPPEG